MENVPAPLNPIVFQLIRSSDSSSTEDTVSNGDEEEDGRELENVTAPTLSRREETHENSSNEQLSPREEREHQCQDPESKAVLSGKLFKTNNVRQDLKTSSDEDEDNPDGTCIICLEPWTNSGLHRLCSLKCGHLFGKQCIETWLKAKATTGRCPQCNEKARKADIRILYTKKLIALDSSERDAALNEAENERRQRKQLQRHLEDVVLKYDCIKRENELLKRRLSGLRESHEMTRSMNESIPILTTTHVNCYVFQRSMSVSQESYASRRIEFDFSQDALLSTSYFDRTTINASIGGSYGFIKHSLLDPSQSEVVKVHSKELRDIKPSPRADGLVLTASLDKTIKITSLTSNVIVQSFELENPVWSCSWNPQCPYEVYGGLANGKIIVLDLRHPSSPLYKVETVSDKKLPIHTLLCIPPPLLAATTHQTDLPRPTSSTEQESNMDSTNITNSPYLLGATLAYPFRINLNDLRRPSHHFPNDGETRFQWLNRPHDENYHCTSLHADPELGYYMSSFRFQPPKIPQNNQVLRPTLHSIGHQLHANSTENSLVTTFEGPSHQVLLSRASIFSRSLVSETSTRQLLAAIPNEATFSLSLYDILLKNSGGGGGVVNETPNLFQNLSITSSTGSRESVSHPRGILDSCHIAHPYHGDFLATLTSESRWFLYRWQEDQELYL